MYVLNMHTHPFMPERGDGTWVTGSAIISLLCPLGWQDTVPHWSLRTIPSEPRTAGPGTTKVCIFFLSSHSDFNYKDSFFLGNGLGWIARRLSLLMEACKLENRTEQAWNLQLNFQKGKDSQRPGLLYTHHSSVWKACKVKASPSYVALW